MDAQRLQRQFLVVAYLALAACASEPSKFYRGAERSVHDTATLVAHTGFELMVDGLPFFSEEAALLPGRHRIVIAGQGYLELDAHSGRAYTARVIRDASGGYAWAVDLASCDVVAGNPPGHFEALGPYEKGCADKEYSTEEILEMTAAGLLFLPVLFVAPALLYADWSGFVQPEECVGDCYSNHDADESHSGTLLLPPWRGQEDDGCDAKVYYNMRCLTDLQVDYRRVMKNSRALRLDAGMHDLLVGVMGARGTWYLTTDSYYFVDGLSIMVEADRTYALCVARGLETSGVHTWVVANDTGRVLAGRSLESGVDHTSGYSPHCPAY